jgi:hypothetical protein
MKPNLKLLMIFFVLSACSSSRQLTYNNSPLINAKSTYTEYRVGNDWYKGQWSIAPEIEHDTLAIVCYGSKESFEFKTDIDRIEFEVEANTSRDFYVRMDDNTYAHTIIQGTAFETNQLTFDHSRNADLEIKYQTGKSDYLEKLKQTYPLKFSKNKKNDTELVLQVLNWTNSQWNHNGNHSPSKNDAITILNEANQGQQFPCFAYAIVLRDQLSALGYQARTVYLKTKDAANSKRPPGHVATEVYLEDLQKWVFVDGQFNVMPTLNGMPLNAVEFQDAIGNHYDQFKLQSWSEETTSKKYYVDFVYDYLYYLDTSLDNRYDGEEPHLVENKRSMMLVPKGAENLTHMDFWDMDVDYCIYTNSVNDFYAKPN